MAKKKISKKLSRKLGSIFKRKHKGLRTHRKRPVKSGKKRKRSTWYTHIKGNKARVNGKCQKKYRVKTVVGKLKKGKKKACNIMKKMQGSYSKHL